MGSLILTALVAYLLSLLGAGMLAVSLAQRFGMDQEFIAVLMLIVVFTIGSVVMLSVASGMARGRHTIDRAAIGLCIACVLFLALLAGWTAYRAGRFTLSANDLPIVAATLLPTFLAILIQWYLFRRRYVRRFPDPVP